MPLQTGIFKPLDRQFYQASAKVVAPRLLGHWLLRQTSAGLVGGPIVETEAYLEGDPACHAFVGETKRNRVLWGPPGNAYVYLIYGFYNCFNAVCLPEGRAEAVLIRAVDVQSGADWMKTKRPVEKITDLTSGPGKLCVAMDIDRTLDGIDLCDANSPIFIAENPALRTYRRKSGPMITTTRIGLTQAADLPLRYYLDKSAFVSRKLKRPRKQILPAEIASVP